MSIHTRPPLQDVPPLVQLAQMTLNAITLLEAHVSFQQKQIGQLRSEIAALKREKPHEH